MAVDEKSDSEVIIGGATPLTGKVQIVDYDTNWPTLYEREADRVYAVLGCKALFVAHTGSTSVPGLPAKPIIDMVLVVEDTTDEDSYLPQLEKAGYVLRVREPDWYEHRMFKGPDTDINLHAFSHGCEEVDRILVFRDWLRANDPDRDLYAKTKLELATKDWKYIQEYADAKTDVIKEIIARAEKSQSSQ